MGDNFMRDKEARKSLAITDDTLYTLIDRVVSVEKRLDNPLQRPRDWLISLELYQTHYSVSFEKELEDLSERIGNLADSFNKFVYDTGHYLNTVRTSKYVKKPKRNKKCAD